MDVLVKLDGPLVASAPPMAAGDHQLPSDVLRLYERPLSEELDRLLQVLGLNREGAEPLECRDVVGIAPVGVHVVVKRLVSVAQRFRERSQTAEKVDVRLNDPAELNEPFGRRRLTIQYNCNLIHPSLQSSELHN